MRKKGTRKTQWQRGWPRKRWKDMQKFILLISRVFYRVRPTTLKIKIEGKNE